MATVHGGLDTAELRSLGLLPEHVLDFSANVNPLSPSRLVKQAAAATDLSSYPDRYSLALRENLAERLSVGVDNLLVGNGSTEIIHLLARAFLGPQEKCLIFAPAFGEYEAAARLAGAEVRLFRAKEEQGFQWPVDAAVEETVRTRPGMVFLCNPNNPTGVYLDRGDVERIHEAVGENGLFVLDDAYAPLADGQWDSIPLLRSGNLAILRSMTKDHALAGIRLGFMAAEPDIVSTVRRLQPAWSVNTIAQAAGISALDDAEHVGEGRRVIAEGKEYLYGALETLGVAATKSAANFVLARVGDAAKVRLALLRRGIAVRDCTSFGLPEYIRVTVRRYEECTRLIESLRTVLG